MPNSNTRTLPVACRISLEAHAIAQRRADKLGISIGRYLGNRLEYDITRTHDSFMRCPHPGCINGYVYHGMPCPVCKGKKYVRRVKE